MGLTVTEDTPADMLAGNMELLVQLPPRIDDDYDNDEIYEGEDEDHRHQQLRNHHRHHNHHHNNGHQRRAVNGNARRVTVARSTPMMDLLVQVATSQKLSASSYTLEAIGEHGLVLTHHPNTPIGALDALQVKLLPKQGTFVPMKTRHVNQPFEPTFRLQVHLPRNQLYVSRVSSRMNLGKILDEVCREKNLDRNNYELRHPANIEETLDLSLSLQDYHLQEVTLCPKRRSMGSSLSSQDIMALQRQEERRRQEAKQSVFGFVFKKSKESSLSTDSLGERSVSPARSDGTGRSASPQAPTAPTRPQRKRRPAPKPPMPQAEPEPKAIQNVAKDVEKEMEKESDRAERIIISHSRNSSDSSGYHEASVLSDNLDSSIRVPETLPRRSRLQPSPQESPGRTLAESSQASKSLGNLAVVPSSRATIARGTSNSSLISTGLRKKKAAPAPPQLRPLSSAISTQALERIVDSDESLTSGSDSFEAKASSDVAVASKRKLVAPRTSLGDDHQGSGVTPKIEIHVQEKSIQRKESASDSSRQETSELNTPSTDPSISNTEIAITPKVEPASEHIHKRATGVAAPVPKPRGAVSRLENVASSAPPKTQIIKCTVQPHISSPTPRDLLQKSMSNLNHPENVPRINKLENNIDGNSTPRDVGEKYNRPSLTFNDTDDPSPRPTPRSTIKHMNDPYAIPYVQNSNWLKTNDEGEKTEAKAAENIQGIAGCASNDTDAETVSQDIVRVPKKPRRKTLENSELSETEKEAKEADVQPRIQTDRENVKAHVSCAENSHGTSVQNIGEAILRGEEQSGEIHHRNVMKTKATLRDEQEADQKKLHVVPKISPQPRRALEAVGAQNERKDEIRSTRLKDSRITANSGNITDAKRSCAVISTVPKCDHFESQITTKKIITVGGKDRKRSDDEGSEHSMTSKTDAWESLGSSFGAGISILDSNYHQELKSSGTSSMSTGFTKSGSDDELVLENFEMFEGSRNVHKLPKLLRGHSERNNFEINTFEGNRRNLTSRSMDFTFALNPNLSRNIAELSTDSYPEKYPNKYLSLKDAQASGNISQGASRSPTTKLPAFLTENITWEPQVMSQGAEDDDSRRASTVVESGSSDDVRPITNPESTSDLLKKVSDTLSGSLRSPTISVTSSFSGKEDHQPLAPGSIAQSVDRPEPGDFRPGINEAEENLVAKEIPGNITDRANEERDSNFPDDRQPPIIKQSEEQTASVSKQKITAVEGHLSSTANDWEYLLPEPPTAFRDTNVEANRQVLTSGLAEKTATAIEKPDNASADSNSTEKPAPLINETTKSKGIDVGGPNAAYPASNLRSQTVSVTSSDIGSEFGLERRLTRSVIKSAVDTESRRGSQASSTPSVAPVDNTLSNFVITTYSRPKNVDIFDEIDRGVREPQVNLSRKNSAQNSSRPSFVLESRKSSSTGSLHKNLQPRVSVEEKTYPQPEITPKNNDPQASSERSETVEKNNDFYSNVNRSNIKISIATKPRPRSDVIINENQRPKSFMLNNLNKNSYNGSQEIKLIDENSKESVTGGNQKFSQWRDDILQKQETPNKEKQLQSLQVLRSILPQLEGTRRDSDKPSATEKANSNPSEGTRVEAPVPNDATPTEPSLQQTMPKASSSNEPRVKRYTYAGPPAIDLGSWSDRSRTTRVQIKPDNDYKVENSRTPDSGAHETPVPIKESHPVVDKTGSTATVTLHGVKSDLSPFSVPKNHRTSPSKSEKEIVSDKRESNELAKTFIARTTVGGFRRPVSTSVESSGIVTLRSKKEETVVLQKETQGRVEHAVNSAGIYREKISNEEKDEEVDVRPRNFKELKEAFAKELNTNSITMPKYGTLGRIRTDNSGATVRRVSSVTLNGDHENTLRKDQPHAENSRFNKTVVSVQEKRNFVVTATNNRTAFQEPVGTVSRRTSRGTLMPVVKGFKITLPDDEAPLPQEKRGGHRVAIGDISNGNYVGNQNGLRKTVHVKVEDSNNGIPKPPPTMPVITGVTLKSNNYKNSRPKSMPVEPVDTRDQLLESIRNFGGQNQLRRVPRRNTNIAGAPGSRSVRS